MSCRRWAGDGFICRAKVAVGLGPSSRLFWVDFDYSVRGSTWSAIVSVRCCWRAARSVIVQFIVELAEGTFLEPVPS